MAREWEAVIGLEVHCQLKTGTKVWCGCSTDYDSAEPNTHVCPICLGHPGVLPKLNEKVLDYAIKAGLALNCHINEESKFDRKNYFYPDTPKNYQITQFDKPYAENGYLDIKLNSGREKRIGITRIHIEEDAGKSIHTTNESFVNFNRASMPLIEIVSEPDIRTPEEAYEYLNTLKTAIKYTGISDVSMELGSLRCDANVSVREKGSEKFGTRTETKNLNSFKAVAKAIEYEIGRQIELLENGGVVEQETLLWDEANGVTRVMRSKEEANDYRYFPEPDLVKVIITNERLERLKAEMPESKVDKVKRFVKEYQLKIILNK
ncbi:MAG: gatB [Fusobacteriales bacterium]|nr:gatB [Fusobacteriales bacterium]